MTDSLFEAVALCSQELMKYSLSAEEFAVLAQKNGMTDSEILAVSKIFDNFDFNCSWIGCFRRTRTILINLRKTTKLMPEI